MKPSKSMRLFLVALPLVLLSSSCVPKRGIQLVTPAGRDAITQWLDAIKVATDNPAVSGGPTDSASKRNLGISYTEAVIMAHFQAVRNNLLTGRAASAIAFDVVNLGLTAAVPAASSSRTKTILAALASGVAGTGLSVDSNLFNKQTNSAMLSAMDGCFMRQQRTLDVNRRLPVDDYNLYDAYTDLARLYGCTTLAGAVQELVETQSAATREERGVIAPVTENQRDAFTSIQAAYLSSVTGDKQAALKFLDTLQVKGLSAASTRADFVSAYRGLAMKVLANRDFRETFLSAARSAGLLSNQ